MGIAVGIYITKSRPCNIQRFFTVVKMKKKIDKNDLVFLLLLIEAVLTSTHNLCFRAKIRK